MNKKKVLVYILCLLTVLTVFAGTAWADSYFELTDESFPSEIYKGDSYAVKGTVTAKYPMASVKVGICDADGKWMKGHVVVKIPAKKTYSLSKVKKELNAENLAVGTYYCKVYVTDAKAHKKTVIKQRFEVKKAFTVSNVTCPKVIVKGRDKPVSGIVSSAYKLSKVDIGIMDAKAKEWISHKTYSPNATRFDISSADAKIDLGKQSLGKYCFRVIVTDSRGVESKLIKKTFEVKKAFEAVDAVVPEKIVRGEDSEFSGKVQSVFNMSKVKIGIYNEENKKWLSYALYNPEKTSFNIAEANREIDFGKLDYGKRSFRVYAWDEDGNKGDVIRKTFEISKPFEFTGNNPSKVSLGNDFTLKGTVSGINKIKKVKIGIVKNGKYVDSWDFYPNSNTYDISLANDDVTFKQLTAGKYYYKVSATDINGNSQVLLREAFEVVKPTFSLSENCTYPTLLTTGSSFYLRGNIYSDVPIKYVRVGVCNSSGSWLSGYNVKKNCNSDTKTFVISTVDSNITFGSLPAGTYYYKVYAVDINGAAKTLKKNKFRIINQFTVNTSATVSGLSQSEYNEINADDVFLKQEWYKGGCTVTSLGMMLRRELILSGVSSTYWKMLTEYNMRANDGIWMYGAGLRNNISYLGMNIKYKRFDSNYTVEKKIAVLSSLLETHPEGIVIYGNYNGKYHATLLTDVKDGVLYTVDPVTAKKSTVADSTMYSPSNTQTSKMTYTYSYWYISK